MSRQIAAVVVATLSVVGVGARTAQAQPADFEVRLERTACLGYCPSYVVTIHHDGLVEYEGRYSVKAVGRQSSHISPDAVRKLYDQIEAIALFKLAAVYRAGITDQPTVILTVRSSGAVHSVEDYAGQMVGMPQAVADLETTIDETAGVERWVGSLEERSHAPR